MIGTYEQSYIGEPLTEKTPRQPTEQELAYMAGLFDGEGYVCLFFDKNYCPVSSGRSVAAAYRLTVGITMIHEGVIRWFHSFWGGSHAITKSRIKNANWSDAWHWRISGNKAEEFLRVMYPYLRVKKHQAALGFKFLQVRRQEIHKGTHRADGMKEIYNKLRSLNSKGSKKNWDAVTTVHSALGNEVKIQSDLSGDGKSNIGNDVAAHCGAR